MNKPDVSYQNNTFEPESINRKGHKLLHKELTKHSGENVAC